MAADVEAAETTAKGGKGKKKLIFLAIGGLLLLVAAGAGVVFSGVLSPAPAVPEAGAPDEPVATAELTPAIGPAPTFVDLPQMLVNLAVGDGRPRFLKLRVAVEVDDPDVAERIVQLSPRIVDSFQMYLRTLTPEELQSPGAMFRLKEDLHVRIHQAIQPQRVADVLFKEMLVQ
ncbi:MAG: flagellar basal body-associated protein FliL [Geminicoccaceae bacterium]|nr:MAG: flagellar basal body-associated protein FliL [Geminicoccaceae bacterium]